MGCKEQEQGTSGLAYLVHHPATNDAPSQTALLLDYVYQLPKSSSDLVSRSGDICYPELNARVGQMLHSFRQARTSNSSSAVSSATSSAAAAAGSSNSSQPVASAANSGGQPRGRVGPRDVAIDRSSVCGSFGFSTDGLTLEALGNFSSCRANVAAFAGKWFYECTVLTSGIQQVRLFITHNGLGFHSISGHLSTATVHAVRPHRAQKDLWHCCKTLL